MKILNRFAATSVISALLLVALACLAQLSCGDGGAPGSSDQAAMVTSGSFQPDSAASSTQETPGSDAASDDPGGSAVWTLHPFAQSGTLEESGSPETSGNPDLWLDSGAELLFSQSGAMTLQGDLPADARWRRSYARSNPEDTDGGAHPQNIFRLITRRAWSGSRQQCYFRVEADNASPSPNRNASNGLLLSSRYSDANDVYYAGVRVDGTAVIKKKLAGRYYTLAQQQIFDGASYDAAHPDLLPHGAWIGLRSETVDQPDGVSIRLFIRLPGQDAWLPALSTVDGGDNGPDAASRTGRHQDGFHGRAVRRI